MEIWKFMEILVEVSMEIYGDMIFIVGCFWAIFKVCLVYLSPLCFFQVKFPIINA